MNQKFKNETNSNVNSQTEKIGNVTQKENQFFQNSTKEKENENEKLRFLKIIQIKIYQIWQKIKQIY